MSNIYDKIHSALSSLESHAETIKKYDASYSNPTLLSELDIKEKQESPLDVYAQEFSKQTPQEKRNTIQSLAARHTNLVRFQTLENIDHNKKHNLEQNESDLTKKIEYFELFYFTMSETERSALEQSIFDILDNTNEITPSEILNMDTELLSGIAKNEIMEILGENLGLEEENLSPTLSSSLNNQSYIMNLEPNS